MAALNAPWSGRLDLNQRPLAPHASALPSCATFRKLYIVADFADLASGFLWVCDGMLSKSCGRLVLYVNGYK